MEIEQWRKENKGSGITKKKRWRTRTRATNPQQNKRRRIEDTDRKITPRKPPECTITMSQEDQIKL